MKTWLIIGSVLLLAGLAYLLMAPSMQQRAAVRSSLKDMEDAVLTEDFSRLESRVAPGQRQGFKSMAQSAFQAHAVDVEVIHLNSMDKLSDDRYEAQMTFTIEDPAWGRRVMQVRLAMELDGNDWWWNPQESSGRQLALDADSGWTKLPDWLNLAHP